MITSVDDYQLSSSSTLAWRPPHSRHLSSHESSHPPPHLPRTDGYMSDTKTLGIRRVGESRRTKRYDGSNSVEYRGSTDQLSTNISERYSYSLNHTNDNHHHHHVNNPETHDLQLQHFNNESAIVPKNDIPKQLPARNLPTNLAVDDSAFSHPSCDIEHHHSRSKSTTLAELHRSRSCNVQFNPETRTANSSDHGVNPVDTVPQMYTRRHQLSKSARYPAMAADLVSVPNPIEVSPDEATTKTHEQAGKPVQDNLHNNGTSRTSLLSFVSKGMDKLRMALHSEVTKGVGIMKSTANGLIDVCAKLRAAALPQFFCNVSGKKFRTKSNIPPAVSPQIVLYRMRNASCGVADWNAPVQERKQMNNGFESHRKSSSMAELNTYESRTSNYQRKSLDLTSTKSGEIVEKRRLSGSSNRLRRSNSARGQPKGRQASQGVDEDRAAEYKSENAILPHKMPRQAGEFDGVKLDHDPHVLNEFLRKQKSKLMNFASGGSRFHILLSRTDLGLSSMISTICYAWIADNTTKRVENSVEEWIPLPVLNVTERKLCSNKRATWLFQQVGIDTKALLFCDDVQLTTLAETGRYEISTVGDDILISRNEEVVSCCTLLVEKYFRDVVQRARCIEILLLAGLILDTRNLDPTSNFYTKRDESAFYHLVASSRSYEDSSVLNMIKEGRPFTRPE